MAEFDPATFLEQELSTSRVARLRKAELQVLVDYLELSDVIPVADLLKPALVKNVCNQLTQLGFFAQQEAERLEAEHERLEQAAKAEHERLEQAAKAEHERLEQAARDHEYRMRELELRASGRQGDRPATFRFDVANQVRLVPPFSEREVDNYFLAFEKTAVSLEWPKDKWTMLLQNKLTGKALATYAALSVEQISDYERVKQAILKAYELVPEAYRQKFRRLQKQPHVTHVEFAREKEVLCDRWLTSQQVNESYDKLRELILLEEFKQSVSLEVRTYLEEHSYDGIQEAAVASDGYVLTHKPKGIVVKHGNSHERPKDTRLGQVDPGQGQRDGKFGVTNGQRKGFRCSYCGKPHTTNRCWKLHPELIPATYRKPVGFVQTIRSGVRPCEVDHREQPVHDAYREFTSAGCVSTWKPEEGSNHYIEGHRVCPEFVSGGLKATVR